MLKMIYTGVKLGLSHYGRAHAEGTMRIFRLKLEEVGGDWRKLHNEELHDWYCSLDIFWVIKSKTTWAEHSM